MVSKEDIPTMWDLVLPTIQAIDRLGGTAHRRQLADESINLLGLPDEIIDITFPGSNNSIYMQRFGWALYQGKLAEALDGLGNGLYALRPPGREILALPEGERLARVKELAGTNYRIRMQQREAERSASTSDAETSTQDDARAVDEEAPPMDDDDEATGWREELLERLHELSPTAFERFVLFLLRRFDLELEHTGGTGDEGIDGIGIAPISPVLSAKVAVQVKRYKPSSPGIGRSDVALFQRDASVRGAERAIMVTLGRFTGAARKAAEATTPMVDLIDGEKLCDLVREKRLGITVVTRIVPQVDGAFFDQFESAN